MMENKEYTSKMEVSMKNLASKVAKERESPQLIIKMGRKSSKAPTIKTNYTEHPNTTERVVDYTKSTRLMKASLQQLTATE